MGTANKLMSLKMESSEIKIKNPKFVFSFLSLLALLNVQSGLNER